MSFTGYAAGTGVAQNQFSFVLLANAPQGTTIGFSNSQWSKAGAHLSGTAINVVSWGADVNYPAGTVVTYTNTGTGGGSFSAGVVSNTALASSANYVTYTTEAGLSLGASGFILSAFQGTTTTTVGLAVLVDGGVYTNSTITGVSTSGDYPGGLAEGRYATAFATYFPFAYYNCADTTDIEPNLDTAINNDDAPGGTPVNWTTSSSTTATLSSTPGDSCTYSVSQGTQFNPGDIAFAAYDANENSPTDTVGKQFSVVLLQPMAVGTKLYFTNDGWNSAGSGAASPPTQLSTANKYVFVTAGAAYPAGTVLTYYGLDTTESSYGAVSATTGSGLQDLGVVGGGGSGSGPLGLSTSLLTLSVYQYQGYQGPAVITSMLAGASWGTQSGGNCPCDLPWNLTDNQSSPGANTAWSISPYVESANYDCVVEDGSEAALDGAINNDSGAALANWQVDSTSPGYVGSDACGFLGEAGPSATPSSTASPSPSGTATFQSSTPSPTGTDTDIDTPTPSPTNTDIDSPTSSPTNTENDSPTSTDSPTGTGTASASPTVSTTQTASPTATPTPSMTAGTTFNAGDIAFVAYNAFGKQFSVALLQPMAAGTTLYFTNDGWATGGSSPSSPPTQTGSKNKYIAVTAGASYPAGTILTYYENATGESADGAVSATTGTGLQDLGVVSQGGSGSAGLGLAGSAPLTLSVYEGSPSDPTVISTFLDGGAWPLASGGNCPCALPWNLTDSTSAPANNTAWSISAYVESANYDCVLEDGP
ncbi:MAG TPA: hypothetical protein VK914_04630, partial [bacterium]|nr:hypothetical protein [bacterium]